MSGNFGPSPWWWAQSATAASCYLAFEDPPKPPTFLLTWPPFLSWTFSFFGGASKLHNDVCDPCLCDNSTLRHYCRMCLKCIAKTCQNMNPNLRYWLQPLQLPAPQPSPCSNRLWLHLLLLAAGVHPLQQPDQAATWHIFLGGQAHCTTMCVIKMLELSCSMIHVYVTTPLFVIIAGCVWNALPKHAKTWTLTSGTGCNPCSCQPHSPALAATGFGCTCCCCCRRSPSLAATGSSCNLAYFFFRNGLGNLSASFASEFQSP